MDRHPDLNRRHRWNIRNTRNVKKWLEEDKRDVSSSLYYLLLAITSQAVSKLHPMPIEGYGHCYTHTEILLEEKNYTRELLFNERIWKCEISCTHVGKLYKC